VGEAPGGDEMARGRYFVGPSGKILWPLVECYAGLKRNQVYVTNLCLTQLDDSKAGKDKLLPEEFEEWRKLLLRRLGEVRPKAVLAVGALAAKALLGDQFSRMEVNNGMTYPTEAGYDVTPCGHPAAALHDTGEKDTLVWTADALRHWTSDVRRVVPCEITPWAYRDEVHMDDLGWRIGIDTEGTPDEPLCITWATSTWRYLVHPKDAKEFWACVTRSGASLVYHNAPWDWAVLEAMGIRDPWCVPYHDTMELAYLHQALPQGLKDLGRRFFGIQMHSWEDVVMPYYNRYVRDVGQAAVEAGTTVITHSPKTGKLLKKPKVVMTPEAKAIHRALDNPDRLRDRLGFEDGPSLSYAPLMEMADYATLDPFVTLMVWGRLAHGHDA